MKNAIGYNLDALRISTEQIVRDEESLVILMIGYQVASLYTIRCPHRKREFPPLLLSVTYENLPECLL